MSSYNSEVSNVTKNSLNINTNTNDYLSELLEDISKKIEEIHKLISSESDFKSDIKEEIAKQILVLQRFEQYIFKKYNKICKNQVECNKLKSRFRFFKIGFDELIHNYKDLETAKKIRHELEYFLNSKEIFGCVKTFFNRTRRESFTSTKILAGLTMAIPIYGIAIPLVLTTATILTTVPNMIEYEGNELIIKNLNTTKLLDEQQKIDLKKLVTTQRIESETVINKLKNLSENSSLLIMVGFAGAFGSIVSIFIRLDQYRYKDTVYKDSHIPILVGFSKPLIGTAFGILIYAMINSNIISIPILQESKNSTFISSSTVTPVENNTVDTRYFLFFTLGFLVGFSERLANDIVKRAEVGLLGQEFGEKVEKTGHEVVKGVVKGVKNSEQNIENTVEKSEQNVIGEIRKKSDNV